MHNESLFYVLIVKKLAPGHIFIQPTEPMYVLDSKLLF